MKRPWCPVSCLSWLAVPGFLSRALVSGSFFPVPACFCLFFLPPSVSFLCPQASHRPKKRYRAPWNFLRLHSDGPCGGQSSEFIVLTQEQWFLRGLRLKPLSRVSTSGHRRDRGCASCLARPRTHHSRDSSVSGCSQRSLTIIVGPILVLLWVLY